MELERRNQMVRRPHHPQRIWLAMVLTVSLAFALGFFSH
jgi:hypothetical protein